MDNNIQTTKFNTSYINADPGSHHWYDGIVSALNTLIAMLKGSGGWLGGEFLNWYKENNRKVNVITALAANPHSVYGNGQSRDEIKTTVQNRLVLYKDLLNLEKQDFVGLFVTLEGERWFEGRHVIWMGVDKKNHIIEYYDSKGIAHNTSEGKKAYIEEICQFITQGSEDTWSLEVNLVKHQYDFYSCADHAVKMAKLRENKESFSYAIQAMGRVENIEDDRKAFVNRPKA